MHQLHRPFFRSKPSLILLDQGNSFQKSRRKVAAQTDLGVQGVLLRSAHEVEGVPGLRDFLAKPVSNRFKQSFRHCTFPHRLLAFSGQGGTAGDDARPINPFQIHVYYRCTLPHRGASGFSADGLVASPHMCGWEAVRA